MLSTGILSTRMLNTRMLNTRMLNTRLRRLRPSLAARYRRSRHNRTSWRPGGDRRSGRRSRNNDSRLLTRLRNDSSRGRRRGWRGPLLRRNRLSMALRAHRRTLRHGTRSRSDWRRDRTGAGRGRDWRTRSRRHRTLCDAGGDLRGLRRNACAWRRSALRRCCSRHGSGAARPCRDWMSLCRRGLRRWPRRYDGRLFFPLLDRF
jgi:hypothetical protein